MWYKYQSQEADTYLFNRWFITRYIFRGRGHWKNTIMISKITTVMLQSTIQTGSRSGLRSEHLHASGSIVQRANTTGNVGCGSDHLLDVLGNEVRIFLWSNISNMGESKSTQQVQLHPRRGIIQDYAQEITRTRLRFICNKAKFLTHARGSFSKDFHKAFL